MVATQCNGRFAPRSGGEGERYGAARMRMVDEQIRRRGIRDPRVLRAMEAVPRHLFVPRESGSAAYDDKPLPIDCGQTISQPYIVALMTEALQLRPDDRVLEVGTGCGYQTAVLSLLCGHVHTIEIVDGLARSAERLLGELGYTNCSVHVGDAYCGKPEDAPYDGIIVTAAPEAVPDALTEQLADGGRLVIPVGGRLQEMFLLRKVNDEIEKTKLADVRFVPMVRGGD